MKLYHHATGIYLEAEGLFYAVPGNWEKLVNRKGLAKYLRDLIPSICPDRYFDPALPMLPPIGQQEIWAAGVTYLRSKDARMEESKDAGGGSFYDRVYEADRPELFFKSLPERCVGHLGEVRIRRDSGWNVPEPELTLFISSAGTIEGLTIGNDMSSRSIEGENPLYLPQAKTYQYSASLGPALWIPDSGFSAASPQRSEETRLTSQMTNLTIQLEILRAGKTVFRQETSTSQIKRNLEDLVRWLFRETDFPRGVYLMTGTGIVPPDDFTLEAGDETRISITGIGTLVNTVGVREHPAR
jgi:2-dehydro-3-deoxy-D-arabinonate dehydratase